MGKMAAKDEDRKNTNVLSLLIKLRNYNNHHIVIIHIYIYHFNAVYTSSL